MKKLVAVILAAALTSGMVGFAFADMDSSTVIYTMEDSESIGEILVEGNASACIFMWTIAHLELKHEAINCYAVGLDTAQKAYNSFVVYTYDSDGCGFSNGYLSFYLPTNSLIVSRNIISSLININEEGDLGFIFINGN